MPGWVALNGLAPTAGDTVPITAPDDNNRTTLTYTVVQQQLKNSNATNKIIESVCIQQDKCTNETWVQVTEHTQWNDVRWIKTVDEKFGEQKFRLKNR